MVRWLKRLWFTPVKINSQIYDPPLPMYRNDRVNPTIPLGNLYTTHIHGYEVYELGDGSFLVKIRTEID